MHYLEKLNKLKISKAISLFGERGGVNDTEQRVR